PIKSGLDAAMELKDDPCKVIILTTFARAGYFERAREANVRGYLLKDSPSEELAHSIRTIMDGRRIYAPELVDLAYRQPENPLTEREKQVIELMAVGKDTKEISSKLSITTGTVRNSISLIIYEVEVIKRIESIYRYKEKGWFKE